MSEANQQVYNTWKRGLIYFNEAKEKEDNNALHLAKRLFKRGAQYDKGANVSRDIRSKVCKSFIEAHRYDVYLRSSDQVEMDTIVDVSNAFRSSYESNSLSFEESWKQDLRKTYSEWLIKQLNFVETGFEDILDISVRAHERINVMNQILHGHNVYVPSEVQSYFHMACTNILFKASITLFEKSDIQKAMSVLMAADGHVPGALGVKEKTSKLILDVDTNIETVYQQILYEKSRFESTIELERGNELLMKLSNNIGSKHHLEGMALLAIDSFKQSQVLARNLSLEQEAHACARLAFIYRTCQIISVKDNLKAKVYYHQSFNLLQSLCSTVQCKYEWARDVIRERENIQREEAKIADREREPVLEKNKDILSKLKQTLDVQEQEIETALPKVYDIYPSKPEEDVVEKQKKAVECKLVDGKISSAIKLAISHYHPDKNRQATHGIDHAVVCEEITKLMNLLYSKYFKNV